MSHPADVVFASSTPLTIVIPGFLAARRRRARFIVEIRDLWPEVPIALDMLPRWLHEPARLLAQFAYRTADEVIALSPGMADGVIAAYPGASVSVIPNCSDALPPVDPSTRVDLRRSFEVSDDSICIYYAGALGKVYDAPWIAALAVALRGRASVRVAGDGAGLAAAKDVCTKAGMNADEVFLGPLSRDRATELTQAGDIALSSLIDEPSLSSLSLNKVFDAFAAGRPVLVNHGGWLADLVLENDAGWHIDRDLTSSAAAATLDQMLDWQRIESAGRDSRPLAALFDRDRLFETFADVLTRGSKAVD